jgi:hypothetical protein
MEGFGVIDIWCLILVTNGIPYRFIPHNQIVIDIRHFNRLCFYVQKVLLVHASCFLDRFYAPNSIIIFMTLQFTFEILIGFVLVLSIMQ